MTPSRWLRRASRGDVGERADRPRLRVERAEDEPVDARVDERARAHEAGLERRRRACTPSSRHVPSRCAASRSASDLRVRGRVGVRLAQVVRAREDRAVRDDDGSDGHLAERRRAARPLRAPRASRSSSVDAARRRVAARSAPERPSRVVGHGVGDAREADRSARARAGGSRVGAHGRGRIPSPAREPRADDVSSRRGQRPSP